MANWPSTSFSCLQDLVRGRKSPGQMSSRLNCNVRFLTMFQKITVEFMDLPWNLLCTATSDWVAPSYCYLTQPCTDGCHCLLFLYCQLRDPKLSQETSSHMYTRLFLFLFHKFLLLPLIFGNSRLIYFNSVSSDSCCVRSVSTFSTRSDVLVPILAAFNPTI